MCLDESSRQSRAPEPISRVYACCGVPDIFRMCKIFQNHRDWKIISRGYKVSNNVSPVYSDSVKYASVRTLLKPCGLTYVLWIPVASRLEQCFFYFVVD